MLHPVASNDYAVLLADDDGQVGAAVAPDGSVLVALVGSLLAQSDWEASNEPMPGWVNVTDVERQIADYRQTHEA